MKFNTIEDAMKSIDFEAISMAMRILNWKILIQRDTLNLYFPTALELQNLLLELYNEVNMIQDSKDPEHIYGECKTGPWTVSKSKYSDSEIIGVSFTISNDVLLLKE